MFADGINMLVKLNNRGYLKKYPTKQILMTPNSHTSVPLNEINEIIRKQKTGMSEQDITNSMVDDTDPSTYDCNNFKSQAKLLTQAAPIQASKQWMTLLQSQTMLDPSKYI